jgi:cytochrome d ubiquinol oxidase subunit II
VVAAAWLAWAGAEGWSFTAAAVGIGGSVASLFQELFPRVMISSTNASYNLTVGNTASPSYTLKVMTVVAVITFPAVVAYQAWGYHVFRHRISAPRIGGEMPSSAAPSESPNLG